MTTDHPVLAVLCATAEDLPPHLDELAGRVELRPVDRDGLGGAVREADALLLWDFFSRGLRDVWDQADRLRWVHVAAAGVDTLLFDELRASDVVVTNARGVFDRPIAEFVLGAVLAHAKRVHESHELQREHVWRHRETRSVSGARALVVGTGGIGRETVRLLRAVGMEVVAAGSRARHDPQLGEVVDSAELADHVGGLDYLVLAAPLTPATRGLVDARVLAALPAHAHLVNVGRGPTVVEEDLLAALHTRALDGATLDVFATEPLPRDSPLLSAPNLLLTPHLAGAALDVVRHHTEMICADVERWHRGEPLVHRAGGG